MREGANTQEEGEVAALFDLTGSKRKRQTGIFKRNKGTKGEILVVSGLSFVKAKDQGKSIGVRGQ